MDTKERILEAALSLFNERGTELVTVREIASKVGISHGNLCYHFPTTDHIIRQLYFNLVKELNEEILALQKEPQEPGDFFKTSRVLIGILYKKKFLMLNFVDIMRRMPDLNKNYRQLQEQRKAEFKTIFSNLVENGIMRPELFPGFFDDFIVDMIVINDFWISYSEVSYKGKEKDKLNYFFRIIIMPMLPLLTEKGLSLYHSEYYRMQ